MTEQSVESNANSLPLRGVRVIEATSGGMRLTGRLLADLGAEVVHFTLPIPARPAPAQRIASGIDLDAARLDRGKTTMTDASWGNVLELLCSADILIEDLSPASDEVDIEALRRDRPDLVIVSVSDFGRTSRFAEWQATEPVFHALSGQLARSGLPGREPLLPPGELATSSAAGQAAYLAVLAYYDRLVSGRGNWLDFSILDGAVQTLDPGFGISGSATAGALGSDLSWDRPDVRYRYPVFACADGHVRICLLAPRQWRGMFAWMGSPNEFADPSFEAMPARFASPTLLPAIAAFFADQTVLEIEREGGRHGVPVAAILTPQQAIGSAQLQATDGVEWLVGDDGVSISLPRGAILIDGHRPTRMREASPDAWTDVLAPAEVSPETTGSALPLSGLRVLDLGVIVVGAETGRLLADAGADVVKIENAAFPDGVRQTRDGSGMSESFAAGQRNKRSLALDLRDPRGKAVLLDLIRASDVLLSNFKPGTLDSLGLGRDVLRAANPRLVAIDSSAFGPVGPASQRLGYGPLVRAASGITSLWTYAGEPHSFSDATTVYPDHAAARLGALSALALLIRRHRTATGGTASIAQAEIILDHLSVENTLAELAKAGASEIDHVHDVPWGVYRCGGDDDWCAVSLRGDADWARLTPLLGLVDEPELADRKGRIAAKERIEARLLEWLAQHSARDAMEQLQAAGIPAGAMLRVCEQPEFDYYKDRGFYRRTRHPALSRPINVEARPVRSARWPDPPQRHAPLMGEHSAEVLADWLGLAEADIAPLLAAGIVGISPARPSAVPATREPSHG